MPEIKTFFKYQTNNRSNQLDLEFHFQLTVQLFPFDRYNNAICFATLKLNTNIHGNMRITTNNAIWDHVHIHIYIHILSSSKLAMYMSESGIVWYGMICDCVTYPC